VTAKRPLVRTDLPGEHGWAEHIEGNLYRSLVHHIESAPQKLTDEGREQFVKAYGSAPEPERPTVRLLWGMIFVGRKGSHGIVPEYVVGADLTERPEEDGK
jgi:hypothetical protein